ncbi:MAG: FlgD immunoglobulin-like domain containing protein [Calditrichia bacterium]
MLTKVYQITCIIALCCLSSFVTAQTTVDQALEVITNDQTIGGNFQVEVRIKGTNLPTARTLGSATIDIVYDPAKLTYVNTNNWAFGFAQGYSRSATNNSSLSTSTVRLLVTGVGVNENGGGDPPGYDIETTFDSWAQINFTIADASGSTDLTIVSGSNAIGLFENYQNEPNTGVINNQTLSSPSEIGDEALPVELSSFAATASNSTVALKWATESEVNNLGFQVLRSNDEAEGYTIISSYLNNPDLEGQGNSVVRNEYDFTDRWVVAGRTYWYRLADVDFAGRITLHNPISITLNLDGEDINSLSTDIPTSFKLYSNYPNPFNPETRLRFDVPLLDRGESRAEFVIYNALGQVVRKLYDGTLSAGTFEITWNGKTDSGANLPSGLYYAVMNVDSFRDTIKMLLIK